jgi:hypothetical protein
MLSVLDADESASPEDAQLGLEQMNDMFALMTADDIDLGFPPQDELLDEFPLDGTTAAQIKTLLAVHLQAFFPSAVVPDTLPGRAKSAMDQLTRASVLANMQESSVRHLPQGEGSRSGYDIITDQ